MSTSTDLQSLVKIGAVTFAGAFLASLTLTTIPTTLTEAKAVVLPALFAAAAAEIVYLRKLFMPALPSEAVDVTKLMSKDDLK